MSEEIELSLTEVQKKKALDDFNKIPRHDPASYNALDAYLKACTTMQLELDEQWGVLSGLNDDLKEENETLKLLKSWRELRSNDDEILKHDKFLAATNGRVIICNLEFALDIEVTHWLPLPEPVMPNLEEEN